ncbi:Glutathione S-transferase S1 [Actinomortierella ambigua]|uniref:Glutathione S-transferase S1 n=1 Tax=Actinomortierella ambigua TaxID=1343610 RepID=A0A9P6U4T8_9FUNG|nr:Glutathione S-transferase S1 [Actinomortierella ambigua]
MAPNRLAYLTPGMSAADHIEVMEDPKATYTLRYFDILALGACARDLLAYGGLEFKNITPALDDDWTDNNASPFGCLPILHIESANGKQKTFISESMVVDQYLAKKVGLLGTNVWEEQVIRALYSSIYFFREMFFTLSFAPNDEKQARIDKFVSQFLPSYMASLEFHLGANGNNGYFTGDKLTLAEFILANTLDHVGQQPQEFSKPVLEAIQKNHPVVWHLKTMVDAEPRLQVWRASAEYKHLKDNTEVYYRFTSIKAGGVKPSKKED